MKQSVTFLMIAAALVLAPAHAAPPDFTDLVEQVVPAVVNIETTRYGERPGERGSTGLSEQELPDLFRRFFEFPFGEGGPHGRPDQRGGGSGFIIGDDGLIITNHHVIQEADEIVVRLNDRREFVAELVGSDPASDVALIRIEADDLPSLRFGDSNALRAGEWVIAVGSPFNFEQSVTAGIVSYTGRTNTNMQGMQYVPFIQTDVAINRGNSGGPLINMAGEVVGINSWILSSHGGNIGLSFSIPIEVARDTMDQLMQFGRVSRGLLGVQIQLVTRQTADTLGLDRPVGALVNRVEPGSSAERAGVEVGDVILEFNGRTVDTSADLPPMVGSVRPGTEVELTLWRWGERMTVTAVLDELPTDEAVAAGDRSEPSAPTNALGLTVESIPAEARRDLGDPDGGVLITGVDSDNAYRAGLRRGQVILMINNQRVGGIEDFRRIVEAVRPERSVALLIMDGGQSRFVAYTPEPRD